MVAVLLIIQVYRDLLNVLTLFC